MPAKGRRDGRFAERRSTSAYGRGAGRRRDRRLRGDHARSREGRRGMRPAVFQEAGRPLRLATLPEPVAGMRAGARVLVLGASAMGVGVVFWTRRLGAGRIVASARSEWREPLALGMGADEYLTGGDDLPERVVAALGGPPDIVFECAGA